MAFILGIKWQGTPVPTISIAPQRTIHRSHRYLGRAACVVECCEGMETRCLGDRGEETCPQIVEGIVAAEVSATGRDSAHSE